MSSSVVAYDLIPWTVAGLQDRATDGADGLSWNADGVMWEMERKHWRLAKVLRDVIAMEDLMAGLAVFIALVADMLEMCLSVYHKSYWRWSNGQIERSVKRAGTETQTVLG